MHAVTVQQSLLLCYVCSQRGCTVLHLALQQQHFQLVSALLGHDSALKQLEATDKGANNVLHLLAVQPFNAELLGMVLLMLPFDSIPKMMNAPATRARSVGRAVARKSVRLTGCSLSHAAHVILFVSAV